tara:strand:- start:141 stop:788 length:648 start_codon:yes stop_codon:yes gene_type:complete
MKTKHINLFLTLFTILLFTCGNETKKTDDRLEKLIEKGNNAQHEREYTDALKYNDAIVGLQAKIGVEILNIAEAQDSEELRYLISNNLKDQCKFAVETLEGIKFIGDDKGLKNAALDLFRFYNDECVNIYYEMADLIEKSNEENISESELVNIYDEYMFLMEKITNTEKPLDHRFQQAQSDFAKANGLYISKDLNPLMEKFEDVEGYEEYIEENY